MAASAFYQDTALQHSARATVEPVYLSQTVWSRQPAILAACQRDRQVELAASIAHWRDQTVCHK